MKRFTLSFMALVGFVGFVGFVVASSNALAQESTCGKDSDCERGFVCKAVGGSACGGVACPVGAACPEPEPCEPQVFYGCVSGPCATEADCADGMVCFEYSEQNCPTSVACPTGTDCPAPSPADCTQKAVRTCVPPYVPPCKVASDCGSGFDCVEEQRCQCSGGKARPADAGAPTKSGDSDCSCTPGGTFHCQMKVVDCVSAGDCPTDWTCADLGTSGGTCVDPGGDPNARDASARGCNAGPTTTIRRCMPPFYDVALPGGTGADYAKGNVSRSDGGLAAAPGAEVMTGTSPHESSGCGCRVDAGGVGNTHAITALLGAVALLVHRRRGRASAPRASVRRRFR